MLARDPLPPDGDTLSASMLLLRRAIVARIKRGEAAMSEYFACAQRFIIDTDARARRALAFCARAAGAQNSMPRRARR